MRVSTIFWICVVFVSVLGLYQVKYQVREIKGQVAALEEELTREQQAVHVLAAEWSYLTRPDRVRQLANQYLKLEPVTASQMMMPASLASLRDVDMTAPDENVVMPVSAAVDGTFFSQMQGR